MCNDDNLLDILKTGGDLRDVVGIWNCSQEQPQRGLRRKLNIIEDEIKPHCCICNQCFETFEHIVERSNGKLMCERCFWDYALEILNAKERQIGIDGNILDNIED